MNNMDDDDEEECEIESRPGGQVAAAQYGTARQDNSVMHDEGDENELKQHINQMKRKMHPGEAIRNDNAPHIPADELMQEQVKLL